MTLPFYIEMVRMTTLIAVFQHDNDMDILYLSLIFAMIHCNF
jgi:hypothetical protein